ncbi:hypothetical protein [Streptomyces sp. NPDC018833]|uniref:hypothetical protein n=1 Tax=Streptomyces sp. NPDC018833 TaxID=3365053 RepID=UPI0037A867CC
MVSLPPPRTTELFYDGQWHAISLRESTALTIERGVSSEGSRANPMAAEATVDNRSGDYSPRNPNSPLYDLIGRNTPIRLSVDAGGPHLDMTATGIHSVSTPNSAALDVLGDIDVRVDVALLDYSDPQMLAIRWAAGGHLHWALATGADGQLILWWSPTGLSAAQRWAESTIAVPAHHGQRLTVRATLDVDDGAGGCQVRFYTSNSLNAQVWNPLGDPVTPTGSGTTSLFDAAAPLYIGDNQVSLTPDGTSGITRLKGRAYGLQVRNGIDGTLVADVDTAAQAAAGGSSFTDATGLVWSVTGTATLSTRHVRMAGEVPAWPPERDLSGNDRTTTISPAGIMRRLGAGNKPLDSALLRFIRANAPIECWPLTDRKLSSRGASLLGGSPMTPHIDFGSGAVQWGEGTLAEWIEPVARFPAETDGTLLGYVPNSADAATGWSVDMFFAGMGTEQDLLVTDRGAGVVGNTRQSWYLALVQGSDEIRLTGSSVDDVSGSSTLLTTITGAGVFDEGMHHIRLMVTPGGSNTAWAIYVDGVSRATGTYAPIGKAAYSIKPGWWASAVTDGTASNGYITYWGPAAPTAAAVYEAFLGHPGEAAGTRVLRVCEEAGVTASMSGVPSEQTAMGFQSMETMLDTLNTAAKADIGYVLEQRDDRALIYRGRATLYNQEPVITLDFTEGLISAPFRPTDDDKDTQNDVQVQRQAGGKGYAVLEEGRMSVLDPPDGVGRYDRAHTLSLAEDAQADQLAYWIMHVGTFDGLRYAKLTLNLGNPRVYAMVNDILRADVGDKIRITNLPADYGPDDVDLIIRGYTETMGDEEWSITFNCAPGEPYDVLQLDTSGYSKLNTAGCELAASIDADDTALTVATTEGPRWITTAEDPGAFPFDVAVGGERMTVTAITQAVTDTFGRTVASGWGTADVGGAWTTSGGSATDYAVSAGVGTHTLTTTNTSRRSSLAGPSADFDMQVDIAISALPTGASIFAGLMARVVDLNNLYTARLEFTTSSTLILTIRERAAGAEATLGAAYTVPLTVAAGTSYRLRFQGDGTTLRARAWLASGSEPGRWLVDTTDATLTAAGQVGCRSISSAGTTNVNPVIRYDNLAMATPQRMTVTRSVNGVVKAHAAAAPLRLADPVVIPL